MPREWQTEETASTRESDTGLTPEGVSAMQGAGAKADAGGRDGQIREAMSDSQSKGAEGDACGDTKSIYDQSRWEYRLESPHEDYQAYKDIVTAERQHELGQQAATADSLGDAVQTTLAARLEARNAGETAGDQWMLEKYGPAPYTEAAYPPEDDE